jgi:hypothetical protein
MPNLRFFIDAQAIAQEFGELKKEIEEAITQGVKQVASMTYAKTQELASEKLKSTRQLYLDNLKFEEIENGIWVVSLDEPALWLEEGRKAGSMIPDLLKRNARTAKDGSRYKAIPFSHNKPSSQTSRKSQDIINLVKSELKARKIPYKKIEYNSDGSPRLGKLHVINNINSPRPSIRASHGVLDSLTIYQTKLPSGKIRRDIMTFRVASTKHEGSKWIHPGIEAKKFMDEALEWAEKIFNDEILPSILEKYTK